MCPSLVVLWNNRDPTMKGPPMRRPLRHRWWALQNWLRGYKFGAVQRHRCCDHTTPAHYADCSRKRLS